MSDHDRCLGWSLEQWAVAAARYPGFPATLSGAIKLRGRWGGHAPLEVVIADVPYPRDWDWAVALMLAAMGMQQQVG